MPDIQILYVKDKYVIDSNAQYCDKNINFVDTVFDLPSYSLVQPVGQSLLAGYIITEDLWLWQRAHGAF